MSAPLPRPVPAQAQTVSALTGAVRDLLGGSFGDVWVRGEISQWRPAASGHVYFTLKDEGAVLPCVLWRSGAQRLRFAPGDGLEVLVGGGLDVYPPHGRYQLQVRSLEPLGAGALQQAFERLRRRLEAEGLFDPARKVPLPTLPRRVALVTSPAGAAVRDLVTVIHRRSPQVTLLLVPVKVQGAGAAAEIAGGLRLADRAAQADVIVVGRGGGSLEDLWAFNEEAVARAIAACHTPVVSAVGHETDLTIADLVADVRAATPSQAGELVVPERPLLIARLADEGRRLAHRLRVRLDRAWQQVEALGSRPALGRPGLLLAPRAAALAHLTARLAAASPAAALRRRRERLTDLGARLPAPPGRALERGRARLADLVERAHRAAAARGEAAGTRLRAAAGALAALSPLAVLARGWSLAYGPDGTLVRRLSELAPGDPLRTRVADGGTVHSRVERLEAPPPPEARP